MSRVGHESKRERDCMTLVDFPQFAAPEASFYDSLEKEQMNSINSEGRILFLNCEMECRWNTKLISLIQKLLTDLVFSTPF